MGMGPADVQVPVTVRLLEDQPKRRAYKTRECTRQQRDQGKDDQAAGLLIRGGARFWGLVHRHSSMEKSGSGLPGRATGTGAVRASLWASDRTWIQ